MLYSEEFAGKKVSSAFGVLEFDKEGKCITKLSDKDEKALSKVKQFKHKADTKKVEAKKEEPKKTETKKPATKKDTTKKSTAKKTTAKKNTK